VYEEERWRKGEEENLSRHPELKLGVTQYLFNPFRVGKNGNDSTYIVVESLRDSYKRPASSNV
jgi:hypothetical protein